MDGQGAEVDGVSAVRPADRDRDMLGPARGRRRIPLTEDSKPPAEVAPAVTSRRPVMRADREVDLATRPLQFVGDLHTRRSRADNQDGACGQFLRVVVRAGVDLMNSAAVRDDSRDDRLLERSCRGHDIACVDVSLRRFHVETRAFGVPTYGGHLDAGTDRRVDLLRVRREIVRDLILRGERIGVGVEFLTREAVVPRGSVRHQGVPPPGTPSLGNALTFQDKMRYAVQTEMLAHRDSRLTRADDENLDVLVRHPNLHCLDKLVRRVHALTGLSSLGASVVLRASA